MGEASSVGDASPAPELVARFEEGLRALEAQPGGPRDGSGPLEKDARIGLAVSGGPDSLGLLLLARALMPERIEAATFDHGLRPESAREAEEVGVLCRALGVPHSVLSAGRTLSAEDIRRREREKGGLQALARRWRYDALGDWCARKELRWLLTAHHADDQAETVLMRLARGSGTAGLSGIRPVREATASVLLPPPRPKNVYLMPWTFWIGRPLLGFSKAELIDLVYRAGIEAVDDPSNRSPRFDRTRARALLQQTDWLDPRRLSAVAHHMRDAEEALGWAAWQEWNKRRQGREGVWLFDPTGLPDAILRRMCEIAILLVEDVATLGSDPYYTGPELTRFIERLKAGGFATLCHVKAKGGETWRFVAAPPRRAP